jgi:hypothetical protein
LNSEEEKKSRKIIKLVINYLGQQSFHFRTKSLVLVHDGIVLKLEKKTKNWKKKCKLDEESSFLMMMMPVTRRGDRVEALHFLIGYSSRFICQCLVITAFVFSVINFSRLLD